MLPIICVSNRTLTITTTIHTNQLHKEPREQYKKENQKTKKNRREITNNLTKSWHLLNVQLIVQQKHFKKKKRTKKNFNKVCTQGKVYNFCNPREYFYFC